MKKPQSVVQVWGKAMRAGGEVHHEVVVGVFLGKIIRDVGKDLHGGQAGMGHAGTPWVLVTDRGLRQAVVGHIRRSLDAGLESPKNVVGKEIDVREDLERIPDFSLGQRELKGSRHEPHDPAVDQMDFRDPPVQGIHLLETGPGNHRFGLLQVIQKGGIEKKPFQFDRIGPISQDGLLLQPTRGRDWAEKQQTEGE